MFQFQRRIVCVDDSAYSFGGWWGVGQKKIDQPVHSLITTLMTPAWAAGRLTKNEKVDK